MRFLQATLFFLFLAAVGIFALQNNELIAVKFLTWGVSAPISVLVVGVYVLGTLSGGALSGFVRSSLRRVAERPTSG